MSIVLRIVLAVGAILMTVFTVVNIRKSKMRIEDSLFWILLSAFILLLSFFPGIGFSLAKITGFSSPVNFILTLFVFILIVKCFTLSRSVSSLENKVKELAQEVAIERLNHYERSKQSTSQGDKEPDHS